MKLKYLLAILVVAALDIFVFTEVASLLRATSDSAVLLGVMFLILLLSLNYFLFRLMSADHNRKK